MFFQIDFLDTLFLILCWSYAKIVDLWTPPKWRQQQSFFIFMGVHPPQRVKHLDIEKRQMDWTFVLYMFFVFVHFSNFSSTVATKYYKIHMCSSFCDCAENIEEHQADWAFEIRWPPKWDPKSTKWRQNCTPTSKIVITKRVSENSWICWCISFAIRLTVGTLWASIGFLSLNFWLYVSPCL